MRAGMTTMIDDGLAKCRAGSTSPAEILRASRPCGNARAQFSIPRPDQERRNRERRFRRRPWARSPSASNISAWSRSRPLPSRPVLRSSASGCRSFVNRAPRMSPFSPPILRSCSKPEPSSTMRSGCSPSTWISGVYVRHSQIRAASPRGRGFGERCRATRRCFRDVCGAGTRQGGIRHARSYSRGARPERARAEALRRKVADALRYPAFVLCAAGCVLVFFCCSLPQFAVVLRDFGAKLDPW